MRKKQNINPQLLAGELIVSRTGEKIEFGMKSYQRHPIVNDYDWRKHPIGLNFKKEQETDSFVSIIKSRRSNVLKKSSSPFRSFF